MEREPIQQSDLITSDDDESGSENENDLIESFLANHPRLAAQLAARLEASDSSDSAESNVSMTNERSKRRVSVFNNVYHRCRIQKRKEKNLCLYLANLYQNLKGFHGL